MAMRNEKTIYTYFSKYNKDVIDLIFGISLDSTKRIFTKKWGPYLNGKGKSALSEEDTKLFSMQVYYFEMDLEKAWELQKKGYNFKQIKAYFNGESKEAIDHLKNNIPERKQSIYDYFKEEERLYVTQAIEWYKNNEITYADVIIKAYGKFYNNYTKGKLTQKEEVLLDRAIGSDLPEKVNLLKVGYAPKKNQRKRRKLTFFAYGEKEELLKKIEFWNQTKTEYVRVIEKLYGPFYDVLNEYVVLTEEEAKIWEAIRNELYYMRKKNETPIAKETIYQDMPDIPVDDSLPYLDFLILQARNQNRNISDSELAEYLMITMEQLDSCYIRNLHLFKTHVPEIIKELVKINKANIEKILTESYLKNYLSYLTIEEQIYLQARLHSYYNSNLSIQDVADYMCLPKEFLKEYQIMTPYEELNQLNKVFKRK